MVPNMCPRIVQSYLYYKGAVLLRCYCKTPPPLFQLWTPSHWAARRVSDLCDVDLGLRALGLIKCTCIAGVLRKQAAGRVYLPTLNAFCVLEKEPCHP